jgi:aarF domain-containing kinase
MEFIDGARVTDREALAELGVSPRALAALVSRTFAEMIFLHGDVHCDPHAANMVCTEGSLPASALLVFSTAVPFPL